MKDELIQVKPAPMDRKPLPATPPPAILDYGELCGAIIADAADTYVCSIHPAAPNMLFHYTHADVPASILRTAELWGTHYAEMNDASEVIHLLELAREHHADRIADFGPIDGMLHYNTVSEAVTASLWATFNITHDHGKAPYIISLSRLDDDIQQWLAYADGSRGACVGLDMTKIMFLLKGGTRLGNLGSKVQLLPVIYEEPEKESLHKIIVERAMQCLRVAYTVNEDDATRGLLIRTTAASIQAALWFYGTLTKHRGFRSEREWRLVIHGPDKLPAEWGGEVGLRFEIIDGRRRCLLGVNREAVFGVQAGPHARESDVFGGIHREHGERVAMPRSEIPFRLPKALMRSDE